MRTLIHSLQGENKRHRRRFREEEINGRRQISNQTSLSNRAKRELLKKSANFSVSSEAAHGDNRYGFTRDIPHAVLRHCLHVGDGIDHIHPFCDFAKNSITKSFRSIVLMV